MPVSNVAFLSVPNGLDETLRQWSVGAEERHVEQQKKEDAKDPDAQGGWDWKHYSLISICVSLCDRALKRQSNGCVRVCVYVCVRVPEKGREAFGEK